MQPLQYRPVGRMYYYLLFWHEGTPRIWLLDDCFTEQQARKKAQLKLGGRQYEIIGRPYNDIARVTSEYKARTLDRTADPDIALKRVKHTEDIDPEQESQEGV